MAQPLMPKATAVWLVENTTLTFEQIARFCAMHPLEIQGIADETVAVGIVGLDPVANNQLTREEISRCEADANAVLAARTPRIAVAPRRKEPRYTPVSKRSDRPDAIAWLLKYAPELTDTQICKLVGTTKPTINAVRTRSHWNIGNIQARDPVLMGLCAQGDLEELRERARRRNEREQEAAGTAEPAAASSDLPPPESAG